MNIADVMTDQALFGREFGGDSWALWRALLGGFYGVEGIDADAFRSLTLREPGGPWDELWLAIGRRGGKSRSAALIAVFEAAFRDHRARLATGEVATVMVLAGDKRQARTVHRFVRGLINSNPMLRRMVSRETEEIIELTNRCAIEIGTASFRSIRGYSIACAILDEIAFWSVDGANPDSEVLAGIRPALATLGGKLVALSSPYARKGALWNTFRRHYGGASERILVAKAPTLVMNPTIDPQVVADALAEDPAAASAEWLAEFRTDVESYISREVVEACIEPGVLERAPLSRFSYCGFCDPSGGSSDSMTLAIAHEEGDRVVVDAIRERKAPFNPTDVVGEFATTLKAYRLSSAAGDKYAGEWPREAFGKVGIRYEAADRPKSALYSDLLPLLNSRSVNLLDEPRLIAQLVGLERRTARGGRDSIDHAPGGHDDVANAVAGAIVTVGAARYSGPVSVRIYGLDGTLPPPGAPRGASFPIRGFG
jgi:hypothetical protein